MTITIGHLGPQGTYSEVAALTVRTWLAQHDQENVSLLPHTSIAQTLDALAQGGTTLAVVPVENSTEGSVTATLDTFWRLDDIRIQQAWNLPITHALISHASHEGQMDTVYSHPQALAQCHDWLQDHLPSVHQVATQSTAHALEHLGPKTKPNQTVGAIASKRAAELYDLPIFAYPINDQPDNCTRFWVISRTDMNYPDALPMATHTSLAFSLPQNRPGVLLQTLQIFGQRDLNLSRIESRPTKRSLGEYLFFLDVEQNLHNPAMEAAIAELRQCTETLKIFGQYRVLTA
ncbi:MAG: prephenate dehydratase [Cyanothece sp. SIO2G6]|nr:prephenate dehydratase [Cyanothece sp. SIO2G6]